MLVQVRILIGLCVKFFYKYLPILLEQCIKHKMTLTGDLFMNEQKLITQNKISLPYDVWK